MDRKYKIGVVARAISWAIGLSLGIYLSHCQRENKREAPLSEWEQKHSHMVRNPWDNIPYQVREFVWEQPIFQKNTNHSYLSPQRG